MSKDDDQPGQDDQTDETPVDVSASTGDDAPAQEEHQEPSLGPACLVIAILSLATFCAVCAFGSWFTFSDQYPLAEKGITQQLIPWVETSQLAETDRDAIVQELNDLIPMLREESIDKRQLTRLHNCLQDNPVLLWGSIQEIEKQAGNTELTETEQTTLTRVTQRLLRAAAERKLGRNDVEFAIQNCAQVREDGQSLEIVAELNADQIREYMSRAEQLVEQNGIPNEPFEKSAAEAFSFLIESALYD